MIRKINPAHYTPKNIRIALTILVLVLLAGTVAGFLIVSFNSTKAPVSVDQLLTDQAEAQSVLTAFFQFVSRGDYAQAFTLYGGDWETVGIYGGTERTPTALQKYCKATQTCLAVKHIVKGERIAPDEFRFTIEFKKSSGEVFTFGPFDEGSLPITQFIYSVKKLNDRWLVMTPPQYAH